MIRLYYYDGTNFGDAMSPLIVERLSGRKAMFTRRFVTADLIAMGSCFYQGWELFGDLAQLNFREAVLWLPHVVHRTLSKSIPVWGTGFLRYPKLKRPFLKKRLDIRALRGVRTREILAGLGLVRSGQKMAYGDPGLLFASLFDITPKPECDLGIVPHRDEPEIGERLAAAYRAKGLSVRVLDARQGPQEVARGIAACARVLSSSLHGLVVADSLGIPNRHVVASTFGYARKDFLLKFEDYYSAFEAPMPTMVTLDDALADPLGSLENWTDGVRAPDKLAEVQQGLRESFPFPLSERACR